MKAHLAMLIAVAAMFLTSTLFVSPYADAQKKPKAKTSVQQQKPKEVEEEQTEAAPAPPAPQPATSISGGVLDIMKKFIGQKTNLGTLKKVNKEFIEFEDDNTILTVPVTNVHSLKQVTDKDENDSTVVRLEVRLIAKD